MVFLLNLKKLQVCLLKWVSQKQSGVPNTRATRTREEEVVHLECTLTSFPQHTYFLSFPKCLSCLLGPQCLHNKQKGSNHFFFLSGPLQGRYKHITLLPFPWVTVVHLSPCNYNQLSKSFSPFRLVLVRIPW